MKNMKFDLKYFILKTNVLKLYRECLKYTANIQDENSKREMREFIRMEFEVNRNEENRNKIEYLIASARKRINLFQDSHNMTK